MKNKKWLKVIFRSLIIVLIIISAGIGYVVFFLPRISLSDVKAVSTTENIEHGKYLANHVAVCVDCHSTRDWTRYSGPMLEGSIGKGGEAFDKKVGFPGNFYSSNITPHHLSSWTDAEIFRVITTGVSKDGHPVFPVMPYPNYGKMDKNDILDIIAYIRTFAPINYDPPKSKASFPMNIIMHMIPEKASFTIRPSRTDTINYGKYLANAASCVECHTPVKKGRIIQEKAYSGGRPFIMPFGTIYSANITPDKATGIGNWSADDFVNRFKSFDLASFSPPKIPEGAFNTIMPWTMYAGMTNEDLRAIYKYLHSLPSITNEVKRVDHK